MLRLPPTQRRRQLVKNTLKRSCDIISKTPIASEDSTFVAEQLPPLSYDSPHFPNRPSSKIRVVNADSLVAARSLISEFGVEETRGKVAVLNLADDYTPGGGWRSLLTAQVR